MKYSLRVRSLSKRTSAHVSGLCVLYLCLHLVAPPTTQGQHRPTATRSPAELLSPVQVGEDFFRLVGAPLRLEPNQFARIAGMTGLTVTVVSALDRPMYTGFSGGLGGTAPPLPHHLASVGRVYDHIGPTRVALGTAGAFAVGGLLLRDDKHVRTSIRIVEAVLFTKLLTGALKQTIGRSRPFTQRGPFAAAPFGFETKHATRSMPSGHTAGAFAVASVIGHQYDEWWVRVPVYTAAASVGIQRLESGKHWFSDVVLGGVLGYMVGRSMVGPTSPPMQGDISYTPVVSFRRFGVALRF